MTTKIRVIDLGGAGKDYQEIIVTVGAAQNLVFADGFEEEP